MIKKMLLTVMLALYGITGIMAQSFDPMASIPADPEVRVGKLDNGLTYYIRYNSKPENQAEFYIFHNVGAIQEDDHQIGLAHFLEHMAFNGTKNLPDKMLINYLETIGVKFGANLNAMTGQEMTAYNMSSVPLNREGIIDTALLILHDWSYFITLDPAEIDNERGVIIEELRTHNDGNWRANEKNNLVLYNNSKYAHRNIIGTEEHLRTFPHQSLVDFYHQWYRTDQQAIIIVGDFDVDMMEAKVKARMSDIPAVQNPTPKEYIKIPDNDEPLIGIATDPELTNSMVRFYIKREAVPHELNDKVMIAQLDCILSLISRMTRHRLTEIGQQPNAPFIQAIAGADPLVMSTDVFAFLALAHPGQTEKAFETLYTEAEKICRFGFTESEFERAQSEILRAAEKAYDGRDDRRNNEFIWAYINNFRKNAPMPDAETEWQLTQEILGQLNVMIINQVVQQLISPENQVILITSPEKDDITVPTEQDIKNVIQRVREAELEAYEDNTVKEPLIDIELTGSPVVAETTDIFGATIWTLGNGVKVILKPTDFKSDELFMRINSKGGLSVLPDSDFVTGQYLSSLIEMSGIGKFSSVELSKQLAGKVVRVYPSIMNYENGLGGSASAKDTETLMQLIYLYMTSPRFSEDDFNTLMERYRSSLSNMESNPNFIVADSLNNTLYQHNMRRQLTKLETLEKIDFNRMKPVYDQLYSNADDFYYIFVGDINLDEFKPLAEKYLGSLPTTKDSYSWKDDGVRTPAGQITNRFTVPMQAPKTTVIYTYTGEMDYNLKNNFDIDVLKQVLFSRYLESIREEKGGTYGVNVSSYLVNTPVNRYQLQMNFDTDPEMADELMDILVAEFEKIANEGPNPEDMAKIREYLVKQRADNIARNATWLNYIDSYYTNDIDMNSEYDEILEGMNGEDIRKIARKIIDDGNLVKVIMDPAAE